MQDCTNNIATVEQLIQGHATVAGQEKNQVMVRTLELKNAVFSLISNLRDIQKNTYAPH